MTRLLLVLIVLVGALSLGATLRRASSAQIEVCGRTVACPEPGAPQDEGAGWGPATLRADEVCANVGYLCAELAARDSLRVLRWPAGTEQITVNIPAPVGESPDRARTLQRAAARGILAWTGTPFPIRVVEGELRTGERADITIRWTAALPDRRLGQARFSLRVSAGAPVFGVDDFALVTRHPLQNRQLTDREVELTAAHEMGHALGLPHSDAERDVMFPENTALHLTARDYRTMEAVYRTANGALILR